MAGEARLEIASAFPTFPIRRRTSAPNIFPLILDWVTRIAFAQGKEEAGYRNVVERLGSPKIQKRHEVKNLEIRESNDVKNVGRVPKFRTL